MSLRTIRVETRLAFPPAAVWRALTEPALLAEWLMPAPDFRPEIGHVFTFQTESRPGFDGIVRCEVREARRPGPGTPGGAEAGRLAYTWAGGGIDTVVTFTVAWEGSGTHLVMEQSGFRLPRNVIPRLVLGFGWPGLVRKKLPAAIAAQGDGGAP